MALVERAVARRGRLEVRRHPLLVTTLENGAQQRRAQPTPLPPALDTDQQRVVDHPGGPLLVLAGPGTGKTTTLVEAIVDRIERRGADPSQVLALTFSRKAAMAS